LCHKTAQLRGMAAHSPIPIGQFENIPRQEVLVT
jgi:hypothetical protein